MFPTGTGRGSYYVAHCPYKCVNTGPASKTLARIPMCVTTGPASTTLARIKSSHAKCVVFSVDLLGCTADSRQMQQARTEGEGGGCVPTPPPPPAPTDRKVHFLRLIFILVILTNDHL